MRSHFWTVRFVCTDMWAPICIFLHVSGQNESVQLKPTGTLCNQYTLRKYLIHGLASEIFGFPSLCHSADQKTKSVSI